jgi:hypothetical protein
MKKKKTEDVAALEKIRELTKRIEVPVSSIAREDVGVSAQVVIKATEEVQELVTSEAGSLLMVAAEGVQEENVDTSKAGVSKADKGNPDSPHIDNIIVVESDSTSTSSQSTSSTSSSDMDNVPLIKVYENLQKALSPSPSTKLHKKHADNTPYEPINSNIDERIIGLSQIKATFCNRLPANHPFHQ